MAGDWRVAGIAVPPGTQARASLDLTEMPDGSLVRLPLALVHGARSGPTLYLGAAITATRPTAWQFAARVLASVDPSTLTGCWSASRSRAARVCRSTTVPVGLSAAAGPAPIDP